MLWIFDYSAIKINGDNYPLEIAIIKADAPTECQHVFHIKYPCNYFNNFKSKTYCNDHGLTWQDGDETLYSAVHTITKDLIYNKNTPIIVNSYEKQLFLKPWYNNVLVFGDYMPIISPYYQEAPVCSRHGATDQCAMRNCMQLLLWYNDKIMYINNPNSLVRYNTFKAL
jgi:hypothetical protein